MKMTMEEYSIIEKKLKELFESNIYMEFKIEENKMNFFLKSTDKKNIEKIYIYYLIKYFEQSEHNFISKALYEKNKDLFLDIFKHIALYIMINSNLSLTYKDIFDEVYSKVGDSLIKGFE